MLVLHLSHLHLFRLIGLDHLLASRHSMWNHPSLAPRQSSAIEHWTYLRPSSGLPQMHQPSSIVRSKVLVVVLLLSVGGLVVLLSAGGLGVLLSVGLVGIVTSTWGGAFVEKFWINVSLSLSTLSLLARVIPLFTNSSWHSFLTLQAALIPVVASDSELA
jgi:hypothetical protein